MKPLSKEKALQEILKMRLDEAIAMINLARAIGLRPITPDDIEKVDEVNGRPIYRLKEKMKEKQE